MTDKYGKDIPDIGEPRYDIEDYGRKSLKELALEKKIKRWKIAVKDRIRMMEWSAERLESWSKKTMEAQIQALEDAIELMGDD
jgi:hypothetical protein